MTAAELRRRRAAAQLLAEVPPPDVEVAPPDADVPPPDAEVAPPDAEMAPQDAGAAQRAEMAPQPAEMAPQPAEMAPPDAGAAPQRAEMAPPDAAVAHLLAVQAQDLRAARLALRARGAARAAAEVDAALAEGALVIAWLLRGTFHLVAPTDYGWLHALTGGLTVATNRRRLAGLGVADPERGLAVIEHALGDGPLDRAAIAERLRSADVPAEGQVVPHLLALAASRGTLVSMGDRYALTRDRLGTQPPPDRDAALAELARRYLRGHGPATAADLAAWSGLGLRVARAGLAAIAGELEQDGELIDLAGREAPAPAPPRLLPAFDPYLLGWKDRSFAVPPALGRQVHPGGGIIRATAVEDGAVVGTWTKPGGRVALDPPELAAAFADEARAVERF